MNAYTLFKHGRSYRKNARFGTHIFIGAHRFKYYMEGRPYYYYSDRPYTISDAKTWKTRDELNNDSDCSIGSMFGFMGFIFMIVLVLSAS